MHTPHPVRITGAGAVTPIGVGFRQFIQGLRTGVPGVQPLAWRHPKVLSTVAAAVPQQVFDPASVLDDADRERLPRLIPMALAAAREALTHSSLMNLEDPRSARRVGLILGTGGGGIDFTLDQAAKAGTQGSISLWTITNATHGNLAGELSIRLGLRGPSWCVSTGCASSSDAMGVAMRTLRGPGDAPGALDALVVVGADAHVRWETLHSMELLRVVSTRGPAATGGRPDAASRPFDAQRDGFVLGEGAWAVVLERASAADARGGRTLGDALGYSATCDAFHRVRPDPAMTECVRAMTEAVEDAGLAPAAVGVVQYHGTATRLNDALETRAVRLAFGPHADRLRGSSIKGAIGHPQGACGLASVVATLGALVGADGGRPFVPPTLNLTHPDPECDLDYTPLNPAAIEPGAVALVNCLAFGAKNSALVIRAGTR